MLDIPEKLVSDESKCVDSDGKSTGQWRWCFEDSYKKNKCLQMRNRQVSKSEVYHKRTT